eukprot:scaffold28601_cov40-Phaeocystis_antarctica.AAC.1
MEGRGGLVCYGCERRGHRHGPVDVPDDRGGRRQRAALPHLLYRGGSLATLLVNTIVLPQ